MGYSERQNKPASTGTIAKLMILQATTLVIDFSNSRELGNFAVDGEADPLVASNRRLVRSLDVQTGVAHASRAHFLTEEVE
jgi:hypothetical protein